MALLTRAPLLLAAAACVPLPAGRELSRRTVAGKGGETTLVAADGARCEVPPARFERTQVGDDVACVWRLESAAAGPQLGERMPRGPRPPARP